MRTRQKAIIICILFFGFSYLAIAKNKRTQNTDWPLEMNSSKSFDVATKCEMLVFIKVFNGYDSLSKSNLSLKTDIKNIQEQSVSQWKDETKKRIVANFEILSKESLSEVIPVKNEITWEALSLIQLDKEIPTGFLNWYESTRSFYTDYIKEQIRLAALYPRITSEILQFSENEILGHGFSDKKFLLTFDDGPTHTNGNTDKLIKVLDNHQLTGAFFVLGENLENRLNATSKESINNLYGGNSVFSHGKVHKSHQKYTAWKESIDDTNELIHEIFPTKDKNKLIYFRPPYGQRNQQLVNYFTERNSKIIFWNIDSRDWSHKLNVEQVANRQIKLMLLLWRKGSLLFHDIHSKAQKVVPIIDGYFKDANINWMNPVDIM